MKRYDHGMKLARTDYKPIDLNNPTDPLASRFICKYRNTEIHIERLMIFYPDIYVIAKTQCHHIEIPSNSVVST